MLNMKSLIDNGESLEPYDWSVVLLEIILKWQLYCDENNCNYLYKISFRKHKTIHKNNQRVDNKYGG